MRPSALLPTERTGRQARELGFCSGGGAVVAEVFVARHAVEGLVPTASSNAQPPVRWASQGVGGRSRVAAVVLVVAVGSLFVPLLLPSSGLDHMPRPPERLVTDLPLLHWNEAPAGGGGIALIYNQVGTWSALGLRSVLDVHRDPVGALAPATGACAVLAVLSAVAPAGARSRAAQSWRLPGRPCWQPRAGVLQRLAGRLTGWRPQSGRRQKEPGMPTSTKQEAAAGGRGGGSPDPGIRCTSRLRGATACRWTC